MAQDRVGVVTGGNRGIGLEVVRQLGAAGWSVALAARDHDNGVVAAAALCRDGLDVQAYELDVTDRGAAQRFARVIKADYGVVDALVNNAAGHYDPDQRAVDVDLERVDAALRTNLLGPWAVTQALLPLLRRSAHPRIVNVSSEGGSLATMTGGTPAYRVSKAALNALTRLLADELAGDGILVNAVCPGWVATDMGGPGGRPADEGAAGIVWAATLPDDGPTGGFFRDGESLPW